MISSHRIAKVLEQCVQDEALLLEGEQEVYRSLFMDLSPDISSDRALIYIDSEMKRLRQVIDSIDTSYDDWQKTRGGIRGLEKVKRWLDRYGRA